MNFEKSDLAIVFILAAIGGISSEEKNLLTELSGVKDYSEVLDRLKSYLADSSFNDYVDIVTPLIDGKKLKMDRIESLLNNIIQSTTTTYRDIFSFSGPAKTKKYYSDYKNANQLLFLSAYICRSDNEISKEETKTLDLIFKILSGIVSDAKKLENTYQSFISIASTAVSVSINTELDEQRKNKTLNSLQKQAEFYLNY